MNARHERVPMSAASLDSPPTTVGPRLAWECRRRSRARAAAAMSITAALLADAACGRGRHAGRRAWMGWRGPCAAAARPHYTRLPRDPSSLERQSLHEWAHREESVEQREGGGVVAQDAIQQIRAPQRAHWRRDSLRQRAPDGGGVDAGVGEDTRAEGCTTGCASGTARTLHTGGQQAARQGCKAA